MTQRQKKFIPQTQIQLKIPIFLAQMYFMEDIESRHRALNLASNITIFKIPSSMED